MAETHETCSVCRAHFWPEFDGPHQCAMPSYARNEIARLTTELDCAKAAIGAISEGAAQRISRAGVVGFESADKSESVAIMLPDGPGVIHVVFVPEVTGG